MTLVSEIVASLFLVHKRTMRSFGHFVYILIAGLFSVVPPYVPFELQ